MATPAVVPRVDHNRNPISFAGCAHILKLRQNLKASDRLRVELGLDHDIKRSTTRPWAGVRLQLDDEADSWAVEVNTDWAVLCTPTFNLLAFTKRLCLPVDARLGENFYNGGGPHVELGLHSPWVAAGVLAASLGTKVPIHIKRKETGGLSVAVPLLFKDGRQVMQQLQPRLEVDATVEQKEEGLRLAVRQLNPVFRLYQQ